MPFARIDKDGKVLEIQQQQTQLNQGQQQGGERIQEVGADVKVGDTIQAGQQGQQQGQGRGEGQGREHGSGAETGGQQGQQQGGKAHPQGQQPKR